ncbi:translation elongation factor Ts [Candidatus Saganbacteria bacterium]|nr:translation elongation factor Ts [Candidatus Saganbacteria bacterium]
MQISTDIIQQLREKTGCGMMDCKKALTEAKGDMEKAADLLRQKGLASLAKRAERVAAQGVVASYIHPGDKIGVLLEVNCESDFVARGDDFKNFTKELALQVAAQNPQYLTRDEVPAGILDHELDILKAQAKQEGKPEKAIEKITTGRMEKFYSEMCLMDQVYIRDPKKTIKDLWGELSAKIGENIVVRRFTRYQLGEKS